VILDVFFFNEWYELFLNQDDFEAFNALGIDLFHAIFIE